MTEYRAVIKIPGGPVMSMVFAIDDPDEDEAEIAGRLLAGAITGNNDQLIRVEEVTP